MPSLTIERGQERGLSYDLRPGAPAVCGRDPANRVVISDPAASRRHFQIRAEDGMWFLGDLGSRNGTFVNEEQVQGEITLAFGDRIQVGETQFSFLEESAHEQGKGGLTGKTLGGYLVLERVGRGGMGTVYRARQISLNRIAALKILSSKLAKDPTFIHKFVFEARSAAQLQHPNVVTVFEVGEASGLHFFSMEFMDCGAVQDELAKREDGRYTWQEAIPVITDAARGLVFAEKRGIVHRDIKPDNLMLTSEGQVKIADLGLATKHDDEGDGKVFGTPHFVSPEQAQGKAVGHAADIYSLGATFYRIVTGTTPFQGKTVKEILRKQINDQPTPVTQFVPDFPEDLAAILDRMMAKRVSDRYASAQELLADLEAFKLAHAIELAGGRKTNKALVGVLMVVLVALCGVIWHFANREEKTRDVYIERTPTANTNVYTGPKLTDADIIERIELRVGSEKQGIAIDEARLGEISLDEKDKWLAIAGKYEAIRDRWNELVEADEDLGSRPPSDSCKAVKSALKRSTEIRERLTTLQTEQDAKVKAAAEWWQARSAELEAEMTAKRWADAIATAVKIADSPEAAQNLAWVEGAAATLKGTTSRAETAAKADWEAVRDGADTKLHGGDPAGALSNVNAWAEMTRANAGGLAAFTALADDAAAWVETHKSELEIELRERLAADRILYLDTCRELRHIGAGETNGDDGNLVFGFHFGAAADVLDPKAAVAGTYLYQDLFAKKAAALRAMQADWERFTANLPGVWGAKDYLKGLPGQVDSARVTLHPETAPTTEALATKAHFRGGSADKTYKWKDLSPVEIGAVLVMPKLASFEGEVAFGLARIFAELGEGPLADQCLNQAVRAEVAIPKDEEERLRREINAIAEYEKLLAGENITPADMLKAIDRWRTRFQDTSFFVLQDGRPAADIPALLPPAVLEEYFDNFGTRPK